MKHAKLACALGALAALLILAGCGCPYLNGPGSTPMPTSSPSTMKYSIKNVFDCYQSPNTTAKTFMAYNLRAPMDAENSASQGSWMTIAKLNLKSSDGTVVRKVSASGTIGYLGPEGFIYIADNGASGTTGYFFSSSDVDVSTTTSVTIHYTIETATKVSELHW